MHANAFMTLETERRKENRKRPPSLVYVELASANGGMMRDICEEGFAVRAMMPLRVGDSTSFAFSVDAGTRFEGACQVLWVEEEGRVAGLKFTEVSPQLLEQVRAWLSGETPPLAHVSAAPFVPEQEVNSLQELKAELRTVRPRVEMLGGEIPAVEDPGTEIPQLEIPRVEVHPLEIAREEVPLMEDAHWETPSAELPPVELPPVDIPPEGPSRPLHDAEISRMEDACVPHVPLGSPELLQEQVERDGPLQFPTLAKHTPAPLTDLPLGPTALEPLPEWGGGSESFETPASASIAHLDPTTVSLAIRILIFLALVATVVVYHRQLGDGLIWLGARLSGAQTAPAARSTANAAAAQTLPATPVPLPTGADPAQHPSPAAEQKEAVPSSPSTSQTKKPGEWPAATGNPLPALKTPIPVVPAPPPTTNKSPGQKLMPESNSEAGQQEYTQAQEILKSKDREAGLPEAVRLLWIAVEKGNSAAEVFLAELYRRGEGVSRNCDQTQILLTAAARKGNGEAQKRLERFLKEGCE
jgi:PilZ domain